VGYADLPIRVRFVRIALLALALALGGTGTAVAASSTNADRAAHASGTVPIDQISPYRFVNARGARFAYRTLGTGRPLVLITGFGTTLAEWDPELLERLAAGRKVIVFDNRGAGLSTRGRGRITIVSMARDTEAIIRALGYRQADVLGWSMGGYIAQELTIRFPQRVRRLVLASTDPGGTRTIPPSQRVINELDDPNTSTTELMHLLFPRPAWPRGEQWLSAIAEVPGLQIPESFEVPPATQRAQSIATGPDWDAPGKGTLNRLHLIRQPTLIGAGRRDVIVPPANALLLYHRIPNAQLVRYRGAGHAFLFQDAPDFGPRVLRFLDRRLDRRPTSFTGSRAHR
jgi:pimeloyl-ACP methyl ester carboxylesterase